MLTDQFFNAKQRNNNNERENCDNQAKKRQEIPIFIYFLQTWASSRDP